MEDLFLFVNGEPEGTNSLYGFIGCVDGPIRAEEDVVGAYFSEGPDEFGLDGGASIGGGDGGDVEPNVVCHAEASDEFEGDGLAKVGEAHVGEDDFGFWMLDGEEEELAHLACVPWFVGVEEDDEVEFAALFNDGSYVGIGDVEVLGVGVELDLFCA